MQCLIPDCFWYCVIGTLSFSPSYQCHYHSTRFICYEHKHVTHYTVTIITGYEDKMKCGPVEVIITVYAPNTHRTCGSVWVLMVLMQSLYLFPLSYITVFIMLHEDEWQHNGSSHFCWSIMTNRCCLCLPL